MDRQLLKGLGISEGIGFGKLAFLPDAGALVNRDQSAWSAKDELLRYRAAKAKLIERLNRAAGALASEVEGAAGHVLDAHELVLHDAVISQEIELKIESGQSAEAAIEAEFGGLAALQSKVKDAYLKERFTLWRNIGSELIMELLGGHRLDDLRDAGDVIVAARALSPFALVQCPANIKGLALESGGPTDHTSILARAYKIPTVLALRGLSRLEGGADAVIDGERGELLLGPTAQDGARYRLLAKRRVPEPEHLAAETRDGRRIALCVNAGLAHGAATIARRGAEGIGLLRSEFLFLHRLDAPGEEEQFEAFRRIAQSCSPEKVVIRTADFGGEKIPLFLVGDAAAAGLRGLRFCLARQDFFKVHLRAILRASAFGDVRIMFPMVPGIAAFRQAKALLKQAMEELSRESIAFNKSLPVGVMIEVPSAAIMASVLALEADFLSIGTNDLCQFTLALDRSASLSTDAFPPSVIHLIETVVAGAHGRQRPVSVCGELAAEPRAIPILVGLGIDELSMEPGRVSAAREAIRRLSYADCLSLADRALKAQTLDEVKLLTAV